MNYRTFDAVSDMFCPPSHVIPVFVLVSIPVLLMPILKETLQGVSKSHRIDFLFIGTVSNFVLVHYRIDYDTCSSSVSYRLRYLFIDIVSNRFSFDIVSISIHLRYRIEPILV